MDKMKVNLIVGSPVIIYPELVKIGDIDEAISHGNEVIKLFMHPDGPGYYKKTGNSFQRFDTVAILKLNNIDEDADLFDLDFRNNDSNNYAEWYDDFCGKWLTNDHMGEKLNIVSVEEVIAALNMQVRVFSNPDSKKPTDPLNNLISAISYLNSLPENRGFGVLIYLYEFLL